MFIQNPTISHLNKIFPKYNNNLSFSKIDNEGSYRILFNEKNPCKWSDNEIINFQAALYTDEHKLIVQLFPEGELYLPKPDTSDFRIYFTKKYFVLNYATKFILVFENKNICEINMQHTVQFYDDRIIAYSSNYNMYLFEIKNNIFVPRIFRICNSTDNFSIIRFNTQIEVETDTTKFISDIEITDSFFTLYDTFEYIKFHADEFNNKRYVLDIIKIDHIDNKLTINDTVFNLREQNWVDSVISIFKNCLLL